MNKALPEMNPNLQKIADSGFFDKIICLDLGSILKGDNSITVGLAETILSDGIIIKTNDGWELYNCNYLIWSKPLISGDRNNYRTIVALTPNVEDDLHIVEEVIRKGEFVRRCHENISVYPTVVTIN